MPRSKSIAHDLRSSSCSTFLLVSFLHNLALFEIIIFFIISLFLSNYWTEVVEGDRGVVDSKLQILIILLIRSSFAVLVHSWLKPFLIIDTRHLTKGIWLILACNLGNLMTSTSRGMPLDYLKLGVFFLCHS